jgi:hypothetical protein
MIVNKYHQKNHTKIGTKNSEQVCHILDVLILQKMKD